MDWIQKKLNDIEEKKEKSKKLEEMVIKYKKGLLLDSDVIEIVKTIMKSDGFKKMI